MINCMYKSSLMFLGLYKKDRVSSKTNIMEYLTRKSMLNDKLTIWRK